MCKFMQILDLFDEHKQKITKFGHSHLHTLRCWAPLQSQPVPPEMQQQDCSNLRICESKGLIMLRALFVLTQGIQWYPLSKHCKHNYGMSLSCPSLKLPWKWHTISIINHDISSTILNIYYCIYFTYITHSYILVKCNPAGILHIRSDPGISDQAQAWTSKKYCTGNDGLLRRMLWWNNVHTQILAKASQDMYRNVEMWSERFTHDISWL